MFQILIYEISHLDDHLFPYEFFQMRASLVAQMVKNTPAVLEIPGSTPGLGRYLGEGNGNPLQYTCLENSRDRGAWWATVHGVTHGVAKSQTRLSNYEHFHSFFVSI